MVYLIQVFKQHSVWWPLPLCGLKSTLVSVIGLVPVFSIKGQRSTITLATFTTPDAQFDLTLALYKAVANYLLIDSCTGQKQYQSLTALQTLWLKLLLVDGYCILECPLPSERGQQLESALCIHLMHLLSNKWICTTAYHLKANGLVEQFHQKWKDAPRCLPDSILSPLAIIAIQLEIYNVNHAYCTIQNFGGKKLWQNGSLQ